MIKRIIAMFAFAAVATSCTQTVDYKTQRDEVMKFHDIVMEDHGKLVDNQMKLDTLLRSMPALKQKFPAIDTAIERPAMKETLARLNKAEDLMNDWMHKFEPDVTGKSNEEAVKYFKAERVKIGRIDSMYKAEIKLSDSYLSKFRK
jgi:MarR-like DNA-binding transcriptional regulator SgrR of sgrS sRNA